jgi:hypothetical protein
LSGGAAGAYETLGGSAVAAGVGARLNVDGWALLEGAPEVDGAKEIAGGFVSEIVGMVGAAAAASLSLFSLSNFSFSSFSLTFA